MIARNLARLFCAGRDFAAGMCHTWGRSAAPVITGSGGNALSLMCPDCCGCLQSTREALVCESCGHTFPIVDDIPVLVPDVALTAHDEVDHHRDTLSSGSPGDAHKTAQAAHFDRAVIEEFEIERPHGTPRLYQFLLDEKFRRGASPIGSIAGLSTLTVCGGSGMDAEFFARWGASVTSTDISIQASRRARERSRRFKLDMKVIVADVEHLPFPDHSISLVAVHDGLHHLREPYAGLAEMARVAGSWIVVTEPARASATRFAIRLGLAREIEAAGNRVGRLEPSEVAEFLTARGYVILSARRYAMYYPHRPGNVFKFLSNKFVFPFARMSWIILNTVIGRVGNKMVVVARRA